VGSNPIARSNVFNHFRDVSFPLTFPRHGFRHGSVGNLGLFRLGLVGLGAHPSSLAEAGHRFNSGLQVGGGEVRIAKRTRGSQMLQRWLGTVLLACEGRFRRGKGDAELAQVRASIEAEQAEAHSASTKKAASP
jgi:hypothetical protein